MRIINPKTYFAFRRIFGSDQSHDILLSFLNAVLDLQSPYAITEVVILDPQQIPPILGIDAYVAVRATDGNGRQRIIAMQVLNMPAGFEPRVLYNACQPYADAFAKSEDSTPLAEVVALIITDFFMFPEHSHWVSQFKLNAGEGGLYRTCNWCLLNCPSSTRKRSIWSTFRTSGCTS